MGNPVVHFEIAGRDGPGLESFYTKLFGWTIERKEAGGHPYGRISTGANGRIDGGIRHEPEGKAEIVLYVEVADVTAVVAQARQLGASVRVPPMELPNVTFAVLTDPEGNPIGLVHKK